jgi:hypothetical protein
MDTPATTVTYRLAGEDDFPVLIEMFSLLNTSFYRMGYRLPHPENVGEVWLDSVPPYAGTLQQRLCCEIDGRVVGSCSAGSSAFRFTWAACWSGS